ncbi:MAG: MBL fold metallo-hydrolase, partial [Bacteroidota bacterium]
LRGQFTDRKSRHPRTPLAIKPFDAAAWESKPDVPKFVWYGHSVLLLQLSGKNFLIDPMLGPNAAPISPFPVKRFSKDTLAVIDSLPHLDAVLMTHDHYDHLDYASIKKLRGKTDCWWVGLGVGRHLERWGIASEQITEFDWWQEMQHEDIRLVYTPSRHFSGRGPTDRAKSFWGGWALITEKHRIYWSGDGGYGAHFQEIGEKLGPFQWGFMECGQYNELWHAIHMMPEESVQAGQEVLAETLIPVHWGGFSLAMHPWQEPAERFSLTAQQRQITYGLPPLGQVVLLDGPIPQTKWYQGLE